MAHRVLETKIGTGGVVALTLSGVGGNFDAQRARIHSFEESGILFDVKEPEGWSPVQFVPWQRVFRIDLLEQFDVLSKAAGRPKAAIDYSGQPQVA